MLRYGVLGMCVVMLLSLVQPPVAHAEMSVDLGFFYDRLALHGTWFEHRHHGWVWYPAGMGVGWRPYTRGHWIFTEPYGWYWVSDFEWGWGPFHYGRWTLDADYGWIWVPGYDWGPAWVAWRTGGGYFGWAPLPPAVGFQAGVGLQLGTFDLSVGIAQPAWVFVEERYLLSPHLRPVIVAPARNVTIIHRTANATNYVIMHNRMVNRSVTVEHAERAIRHKMRPVQVQEVDTVSRQGERQNVVNVFRPTVRPVPATRRPMSVQDETRRRAVQQEILQERQRTEQRQLEREHEQERHQPRMPVDQLQRQHDAERRFLDMQQERERQVQEHRQQQMWRHDRRRQQRQPPHSPQPPQQRRRPGQQP